MTSEPADPPVASAVGAHDGLSRRQARERARTDGTEATGEGEPGSTDTGDPSSGMRNLLEWVAVIVGALLIAIVVRTFLLQTFWIPSPSMSPTLVRDDRVLVNKLSYRFGDIGRGDVIVFSRPPNEPPGDVKDLIKRVVALPGERVSLVDGQVRIDGRLLEEPYVNGLQTIYNSSCSSVPLDGIDTPEGYLVPDGNVFVLGDNRVNSHDGRCFGPIEDDTVVGRAFFVLWPPSHAGGL